MASHIRLSRNPDRQHGVEDSLAANVPPSFLQGLVRRRRSHLCWPPLAISEAQSRPWLGALDVYVGEPE